MQNNSYEKLDVVLQGQYTEFTEEIIENYSKLPFVNNIILSCWNEDNVHSKRNFSSGIILVSNQKPITFGDDNINLQIVSSLNGLKILMIRLEIQHLL